MTWAVPALSNTRRAETSSSSSRADSMAGLGAHPNAAIPQRHHHSSEQVPSQGHPPQSRSLPHQHHNDRDVAHVSSSGVRQLFVTGEAASSTGIMGIGAGPRTRHAPSHQQEQLRAENFSAVHEIHLSDEGNYREITTAHRGNYQPREAYAGPRMHMETNSLEPHHADMQHSHSMMSYNSQFLQPSEQPLSVVATRPDAVSVHNSQDDYHLASQTLPLGIWGVNSQPMGIPGVTDIPAYNNLYDMYFEIKQDSTDPSMQLPSARLATL